MRGEVRCKGEAPESQSRLDLEKIATAAIVVVGGGGGAAAEFLQDNDVGVGERQGSSCAYEGALPLSQGSNSLGRSCRGEVEVMSDYLPVVPPKSVRRFTRCRGVERERVQWSCGRGRCLVCEEWTSRLKVRWW